MLSFEVGKEFPLPPVKEEGAVFSVEPFTLMLVYRYSRPSQEEINEFKNGTFQIAVTELRHVLFVATQFGRLNWADAPYSTHFSDAARAAGIPPGLCIGCISGGLRRQYPGRPQAGPLNAGLFQKAAKPFAG